MISVIKRNGNEIPFDSQKIIVAVSKANKEVPVIHQLSKIQIEALAESIEKKCEQYNHAIDVEVIQGLIEQTLMEFRAYEVAQKYIRYRYSRELSRKSNTTDSAILSLIEYANEQIKQENSNKNAILATTQRDYIAGEVSKDITNRILLPPDIVEAFEKAILQFHDADYFIEKINNCCLVNLEDQLQNGTVISEVKIDPPHSLLVASNVSTQIVSQVASSQYGGQTISLAHLAPFVDISRQRYIKEVRQEGLDNNISYTEEQILSIAEARLKKEITSAIQTIQYQLITIMTTNGQAPFVSIFMYLKEVPEGRTRDDLALLIEEVLKQRIQGVKNEDDVWTLVGFPKLLYVTCDINITEDSPYWYLTKLAAECSIQRMVPDYISEKKMLALKGNVYPCMGCRSFLTPDRFTKAGKGNISKAKNYIVGQNKYYGRFNQGVVTINLPYIACLSNGDMEAFWDYFEDYLELCHKALKLRHNRLKGTSSQVAPILWRHGALARLDKDETIDALLYDGYSTISLGYAGLYECCVRMTGHSHTDPEGKPFALSVMQYMNEKCSEWKDAENIDYSLYGTPLESTTYRFAKALQRDFGIIKDVSDHNYVTNSYHVNVREEIDAFTKLKFESEFQALSPGGAISYIEIPDMRNNIDAVLSVIKFIHENIMYAELNTKSDYCSVCGYNGEIKIAEKEDSKLVWKCPQCGCEEQEKLFIARRTCGYIGTQKWNQGRTQEIRDRVLHL